MFEYSIDELHAIEHSFRRVPAVNSDLFSTLDSPSKIRGPLVDLQEVSGIALRHVRVDWEYWRALDEACYQVTRFGVVDDFAFRDMKIMLCKGPR